MQRVYTFINIDVYRKRNYTYIYSEPAVYIREYIEYTVSYSNSAGLETVPPCSTVS